MEHTKPIVLYRTAVFALAAFFMIYGLVTANWSAAGASFRYLTIWALWMSGFSAACVLMISLGKSGKRFDAFISAAAIVNAMVLLLYWRLYFADPLSVTRNGELGVWWREYYMHGLGAVLLWIDALFINRVFRKPVKALAILLGTVITYIAWIELYVQRFNDDPVGSVTTGLPYPFLNNLEFAGRSEFYITNIVVAVVLLAVFLAVAFVIRRVFPRQ